MIADFWYKIFLIPNKEYLVIFFLLSGLYFINQKNFYYIISTGFFTTICSSYLKNIWQIPLNESIFKTGFAYPSGHTMFNSVMYGLIFFYYRSFKVFFILILLLILEFCAMVHFQFHNWIDIFGGVCFASVILILACYWIANFSNFTKIYGFLLIATSILMISKIPFPYYNHFWHWHALGILISFTLLNEKIIFNKYLWFIRIMAIATAMVGNVLLKNQTIFNNNFIKLIYGVFFGALCYLATVLVNIIFNYSFKRSCSRNSL